MKRNDYQGKRKDQIEFSENVVTYSVLGIILMLIIMTTLNILSKL